MSGWWATLCSFRPTLRRAIISSSCSRRPKPSWPSARAASCSAFTGWGKTLLGYHAAYVTGRKTLVVTTKDDIYKQWIEGAQKFLQLPAARIGEIRGDKCEVQGTDFCVAMIHSLSKDGKYPEWITKGFGLIIYDEVHRLPAEQFSVVADMFPAAAASRPLGYALPGGRQGAADSGPYRAAARQD